MRTHMFLFLAAVVLAACTAEQAGAIPAFARKYDMSCNVCHSPIPKLKTYGEEFAANGFQLPDKEPPRSFRETGDAQLQLMRDLPIALRLEGYGRWETKVSDRSDFQAPYLLKFLSGGQIARNISYYFYFFLGERGEVAGLEDAFVMFNNVFSTDLDVTAGQFQVCDPLFKRELRLTLEDYQVYRMTPGNSRVNLTYDRGIMLAYPLPSKTDLTLAVVNGSGIGAADLNKNFDTDKYKNFFVRASQEVDENIRVGGFGYYGKEEQAGTVNTMWMIGPDMTFAFAPLELNIQYIERRDDNPLFFAAEEDMQSRGMFGELVYSPDGDKSEWYAAALYNWEEIGPGTAKYHSATAHVSRLLARNFRLIGEYTYDVELDANRVSVGFVSAF